jgi:hypothetical protein
MGRTRLPVACIAAMLVSSLMMALMAPAASAAGTCASHGNYFDGYTWDGTHNLPGGYSPEGASAGVTVRVGLLCSGISTSANDNTVWTMLAQNQSVGDAGYAQIGYLRSATSGVPYHFSEWRTTGNTPNFALYGASGSLTTGSTYQYWVQYINSGCPSGTTACLAMNIGTTRKALTNFNPWAANGFDPSTYGPMRPQLFGEMQYAESDEPGSATSPVAFRDVQIQNISDAWITNYGQYFVGNSDVTGYCRTNFNYTAGTLGFNVWEGSC